MDYENRMDQLDAFIDRIESIIDDENLTTEEAAALATTQVAVGLGLLAKVVTDAGEKLYAELETIREECF